MFRTGHPVTVVGVVVVGWGVDLVSVSRTLVTPHCSFLKVRSF